MSDIADLPPHMQLFAQLRDEVKSNYIPDVPEHNEISTQIYLDEQWLERERSELYQTSPIILGHEKLIERPGEHFTHDHLGKPLLVVRGQDQRIRVFYNVCRHRGVRLARNEEVGRKPSFVCPYHHWAYDLDGTLKNVPLPETFEGVDLSCRNLKEVPSETRHGFIWAQIDTSNPLDLDAHLLDLNSDLESFRTDDHHVFRQTTTIKKSNWKLIVEAFQDGYHVTRLHQKSVGPLFMDARASMNRVGDNLRAVVARAFFPEVLDLPPSEWDDRNHVSFAHFIFPNTIMVFHPDYISHMGLFPQSVDETTVVHTCLIPKPPETEKELEHWERAFDIIENGVFQAEDFFVCENAQIGMASGANETLLLGAHEYGLAMFHEILREKLGPFSPNSG